MNTQDKLGFFTKVRDRRGWSSEPGACVTDFIGSLEEAKYLRNNGALSAISKIPFILGMEAGVWAMEIS